MSLTLCFPWYAVRQEGAEIPRVGSVMSLGGLGGTYGGPPDCVKASYEKLHLTSDELQHLTRQVQCPAAAVPHHPSRSSSPPRPGIARYKKEMNTSTKIYFFTLTKNC